MDHYVYKGLEEPSIASVENSPTAQSLAAELQNPAAPGERHTQIRRTIMPLIELGLHDTAIFTQYRRMYDADLPDSEIEALIKWGRERVGKNVGRNCRKTAPKKRELSDEQKNENAVDWLSGFRIDPTDLWEESEFKEEKDSDAAILYLNLYRPEDFINFNTRYLIRKLKDGSEKAELCGPGETHPSSEWIDYIQANGVPEGRAGVWVRINPLRSICGNSQSGAHTDADVLRYSHLLLETDILPYDIALSLFAKVPLPICAIIDSAGRGPHGIVGVAAANAQEYARKAKAIFDFLGPLGIDPGNGNPSRYSRLPGARRIIGARNGAAVQQLLYLTSTPRIGGIFP